MINNGCGKKGFTLIELVVAMTLAVLVMGLILGPVIQSFDFTRQVHVTIEAQDSARIAMMQLTRDLGNAMFIYDNTRDSLKTPSIREDGTADDTTYVQYARIDLVLPRMHGYCTSSSHPSGEKREYSRGEYGDLAMPVCPKDASILELRPVQPLAPDTKIVRYFIGLQDPARPYSNHFVYKKATGPDNVYVLYRAEISYDDFPKYFSSKDAGGNTRTFNEKLSDPDFFYNTATNPDGITYSEAWKKISRSVIKVKGADLVSITYNDGNTIVTPTIKFAPTPVYNDPLVPVSAAAGKSDDDAPPATVYKASFGNWILPYEVKLTRDNGILPSVTYYTDAFASGSVQHMGIFAKGSSDLVFDITKYMDDRAKSAYHAAAISGTAALAFTVDTARGMVNFAFPVVDQTASANVASIPELGGEMAVSKIVLTRDINSAYLSAQTGSFQDVSRLVKINEPASSDICLLANGTVVPGSVRVAGPNAQPGPKYGEYMQYSMLPYFVMDPGLNQFTLDTDYVINLAGVPDSSKKGTAAVYFHSLPATESALGDPLPEGPETLRDKKIYVYYEVQNNKQGDILKASYSTKSLITVNVGVRVYNITSGKPASVQLTNKVRVKNVAS
jgi:prepilin-type N-terminal cleavage/methylation domain-containing protein